jgi:UDP-glucose 4-epimerase
MTNVEPPAGSRIFITGGAGFIGSRLAMRCLAAKSHVTIYDNFVRNALQDEIWINHPNIHLVKGDILDRVHVADAMSGHDIVFHCAAVLGVDSVRAQPVRTMEVNVLGSVAVLEAASQLEHMSRLVCFSTSEIYGVRAVNASEHDDAAIPPAGEPRWSYAASKLAEEHFAFAYHRERGVPITVVRPFNVYGPGQVGEGAIANFIRRGLRNEPLQVRSGGKQIRAWCFVEDMIDGAVLAACTPEAIGQTFNIGNPWAVEATLGLAHRVLAQLPSRSIIEHVAGEADVDARIPDIKKATDLLGYKPQIGLDDGISRSIVWFKEHST